ncbi:hypothetical protein, partial [Burkholderia gladioli]|uniref:hypothetical protein n=4 Tax=Burkholderia gladioli TaxID=28095 RepID=UPI001ABA6B50
DQDRCHQASTLIGCRFLKSVSAKQLGFFSSAAFSAAEKRDYDQHFAARQLLFSAPRSTHCVDHFSVKRASCRSHLALSPSNLASPSAPRFR